MAFEKGFTHTSPPSETAPSHEIHPILARMHPKAEAILRNDAIDPVDFISLYGEENVRRDLRNVELTKANFENTESKIAAETLEAIITEHTELSNWLGPNAETIKTAEFDDIKNGVDLVLEFDDNHTMRHLALGIDVTFGVHTMRKKFDRIRDEIHADELAHIKYFKAHGYQGSLKQLPRLVVGVEIGAVINLAGLWERKENKTLSEHVAKDILVDEIERQLRAFLIYAKTHNAPNAVKSYTHALGTMRHIRTLRNGFRDDKARMAMVEKDRVHQEILRNLERFR